jgi:endonuclease III-like uncharacterized protein
LPEDAGYDRVQEFFMNHLPPETGLYNEYHALIDALGNTLCASRKPRCTECPLEDICGFHSETSRCISEGEADGKVSVADTRQ